MRAALRRCAVAGPPPRRALSSAAAVDDRLLASLEAVCDTSTNASILARHGKDESHHACVPPDVASRGAGGRVSALLRLCHERRTPVVPFGVGTSLEGHVQAPRGGLSIDVGAKMTAMLEKTPATWTAAEAGARKAVNAALRHTGLEFMVDPGADATVGGMAACGVGHDGRGATARCATPHERANVEEQADVARAVAEDCGGSDFAWSADEGERNRLWARHSAYYAAAALKQDGRAVVTDACVPLSALADVVERTAADVAAAGVVGPIFGHAGDGNFHCILVYNGDDDADYLALHGVNAKLVARAIDAGGTCTGSTASAPEEGLRAPGAGPASARCAAVRRARPAAS
ncbi:cytokinin dehydrogenase [Aureococcus anophagefferens]|nr:cytokinin dehydrogenase [Aureococcus anophagefferens]